MDNMNLGIAIGVSLGSGIGVKPHEEKSDVTPRLAPPQFSSTLPDVNRRPSGR